MDIFIIAVAAICAVILAAVIKKPNKEMALLVTVLAVVLILVFIFQQSSPLIERLQEFASLGFLDGAYIAVLLKAVGITIVGQVTSSICKDAGESALAYTVETATKAAILIISLPIILNIFEYLGEILKI